MISKKWLLVGICLLQSTVYAANKDSNYVIEVKNNTFTNANEDEIDYDEEELAEYSNEVILNKIQTAIKNNFSAYNVNIIVKDGNVTLEGTVDTAEQKKHIEEVVRGVEGVKEIKNDIKVEKK